MRLDKALHRDNERRKRTKGLVIDGKGVFILEEILRKKAEKVKRKQERQFHKEEIGEELHDD
jgi:hypothetical protein